MKEFNNDQILALREIERSRVKKGLPGFHDDIQALIARYKDGAKVLKSSDPRLVQAKVLWDKGVGRELGFKTFKTYLATIPQIPASLLADDPNLPLLRLVDPRLGISKSCKLIGIKFEEFGYSDADAIACDSRHETPTEPFWVRAHNGRKNRNRRPDVCRNESKDNLFAMTAMVAIFVWVQDPSIIKEGEHVLDCPGSVLRAARGCCACLRVWGGEVKLYLHGHADIADAYFGSGGFRRE